MMPEEFAQTLRINLPQAIAAVKQNRTTCDFISAPVYALHVRYCAFERIPESRLEKSKVPYRRHFACYQSTADPSFLSSLFIRANAAFAALTDPRAHQSLPFML